MNVQEKKITQMKQETGNWRGKKMTKKKTGQKKEKNNKLKKKGSTLKECRKGCINEWENE